MISKHLFCSNNAADTTTIRYFLRRVVQFEPFVVTLLIISQHILVSGLAVCVCVGSNTTTSVGFVAHCRSWAVLLCLIANIFPLHCPIIVL